MSLLLGLTGMPAAAEEVMIGRDIALAEVTGGRLHVMHVSTAGGVALIRAAKARGARVTAEACPHHFTLTDECLRGFDSNFKMSPPLRSKQDRLAVREGLADGTLDAPLTDEVWLLMSSPVDAGTLDEPTGLTIIQPASALPAVNRPMNIDGSVAAGKIVIDGSLAPPNSMGLLLGGVSTIRNMEFRNWTGGVGLALGFGSAASVVQRNVFTFNRIGLNINGANHSNIVVLLAGRLRSEGSRDFLYLHAAEVG